MLRIFRPRNLAVIVLVLVASASVYAFAAANVVGETGAGAGSGTISGYTISSVTYTLNSTDPEVLDAVTFDINPTSGASAPTQVEIQLDSSTSTWYSCAVVVSPQWSCDTTGTAINVADMDLLNVVATE